MMRRRDSRTPMKPHQAIRVEAPEQLEPAASLTTQSVVPPMSIKGCGHAPAPPRSSLVLLVDHVVDAVIGMDELRRRPLARFGVSQPRYRGRHPGSDL
jgi:hypothetical protein